MTGMTETLFTVYLQFILQILTPTATIKRKAACAARANINCLPVQVDYQKYMGGAHHTDQLVTTVTIVRKTRKA